MDLLEKIFQRNDKFFLQVYYIILAISLGVSSTCAYYLKNETWILSEFYLDGAILVVVIFWVLTIIQTKEVRFIQGTAQWFRIEFFLLIETFIIAILLTVIFKVTGNYSRVWLFSNFGLAVINFLILKVFFDYVYAFLIKSNTIQRNILLIGDVEGCQNIINKFPKKTSNSIIKCLIVIDQINNKDLNFYGVPSFNLKDNYNDILNHHSIGQIWILSSVKTQPYIEMLIDKFMNFSVDCRLILPESKFKFIEGLDSEAGFDFYNVSFSPFYGFNFLIKNIIDKLLSLIFILISLPLLILGAIFILIEDGFPIIYKQKRTGWDGKSFNIFKLRSLYKKNNSEETKQVMSGDSRILIIGKIIRRFSIDELPQFFNVLKGDMSIVGPRPHMLEHTRGFTNEVMNFMQRHKCLPGITGWAQVNGLRGPTQTEGAIEKRFQHDLYYIKNWNLMLDFYILIKTIFVVLFQKVD